MRPAATLTLSWPSIRKICFLVPESQEGIGSFSRLAVGSLVDAAANEDSTDREVPSIGRDNGNDCARKKS